MSKTNVDIMYKYTCKFCNTEFYNKNKNKKYCSQKCTKEDNKRGHIGKCTNCQKEFYVARYKSKSKNVFCSFDCTLDFQRKRRPVRICQHCGNEFKKKCRSNAMFCSSKCRLNSEHNILQLAHMRKKQSSRTTNKLEKMGYEMLSQMGLNYEKQFIYSGTHVADAFLIDYSIIIQFDGDFWHANPNKYSILSEYQKKIQMNDVKSNLAARKCGYEVIRIWESDIKNQLDEVKSKILNFIEEKRKNPEKNN